MVPVRSVEPGKMSVHEMALKGMVLCLGQKVSKEQEGNERLRQKVSEK